MLRRKTSYPSFQDTEVSFNNAYTFISALKQLEPQKISDDESIQTKLIKLKFLTELPLCAEQVISILDDILCLKYRDEFNLLSKHLHIDEANFINTLAISILPLLELERNIELHKLFVECVHEFTIERKDKKGSEKHFHKELKCLRKKYVSCLDVDYIMQAATEANKVATTSKKNAILVTGMTGAGKSFFINYMCCEAMFKREGLFGRGKIVINEAQQPGYLQHIKIGKGTVSVTSKMNVVSLDQATSKGMELYRGKNYILCDIPGARDNREGNERKLVNGLQTIMPMHKAQSVRVVVLISALAISARGNEFRETIKYVAKMFRNVDAIKAAAKSFIFAISGDLATEMLPELKNQLEDFEKDPKELQLNECDLALIQIMKEKFTKNQVEVIQPIKNDKSKPATLMKVIDACDGMNPAHLLPYAEADLIEVIEQECSLLNLSINQIIRTLHDDIPYELMQTLIQRLHTKLAKLSFMDFYFAIQQTNIQPIFADMAILMQRYADYALTHLCPDQGLIDAPSSEKAIAYLKSLRELESTVRVIINGIFAEKRDRVVAILSTFNAKLTTPNTYQAMPYHEWTSWVKSNMPPVASLDVEEKIKSYRFLLANRLKGLLQIHIEGMHLEQLSRIMQLTGQAIPAITHAENIMLESSDLEFIQHADALLTQRSNKQEPVHLEHYRAELEARHASKCKLFYPNIADKDSVLQDVIKNLCLIDSNLKRLFHDDIVIVKEDAPEASAPPLSVLTDSEEYNDWQKSLNILSEQHRYATVQLLMSAREAIFNTDLVSAMLYIDHINRLSSWFGFNNYASVEEIQKAFFDKINATLDQTIQYFDERITTGINQSDMPHMLLLMMHLEAARTHPLFSHFIQANLYPDKLQIKYQALNSAIYRHFANRYSVISTICHNEYQQESFAQLGCELQQIWYVLALSSECRDILKDNYAKLCKTISDFCMGISGKLSGKLEIVDVDIKSLYTNISNFYRQLRAEKMVGILSLQPAIKILQDALVRRAQFLTNKSTQIDLGLNHENHLVDHSNVLHEINLFISSLSNVIDDNTNAIMRAALYDYMTRVTQTLEYMEGTIKSWSDHESCQIIIKQSSQMQSYLDQCSELQLFPTSVARIQALLANFSERYTLTQRNMMTHLLSMIRPDTPQNVRKDSETIVSMLESFLTLQQCAPGLYAAIGAPVSDWLAELTGLVSIYQKALAVSLLDSTLSGQSINHKVLMQCVTELIQLDRFIKQDRKGVATFRKLYKRFENALADAHFPKLQLIMRAIYNANFEHALQLVTDEKAVAPGTELRVTLMEQIAIFISANINNLDHAIHQLSANPMDCDKSMSDILSGYARIKSADRLVEGGLLSSSCLSRRDQQIINCQTAIDAWLTTAVATIDKQIQILDFSSATRALASLQQTLTGMRVIKPKNHSEQVTQLVRRYTDKPQYCLQQYQQPVREWQKHIYSIREVATAFCNAADISIDHTTFGELWKTISNEIFLMLANECAAIQKRFIDDVSDIQETVTALEYIAALIEGLPNEPTNLQKRVKEAYQQAATAIQEDNITHKKDDVMMQNIQTMVIEAQRGAKSVNRSELARSLSYLNSKWNTLVNEINTRLKSGDVPVEQLVHFAKLSNFFSMLEFVAKDKQRITGQLNELVDNCLDAIPYYLSFYQTNTDKVQSLKNVYTNVARLVEVQRLIINTKDMSYIVNVNLPLRLAPALVKAREILKANSEKFKAALTVRNTHDLNHTLLMALEFQDITQIIQTYIHTCRQMVLGDELITLNDLASQYCYAELRKLVIEKIKTIRFKLNSLSPKSLVAEGSEIRRLFYTKLRRNFDFLHQMPLLQAHLTPDILATNGLTTDYGMNDCLRALSGYLAETFRLAHKKLTTTQQPSVNDSWVEFNRYYQELTLFIEICQGQINLDKLKLAENQLIDIHHSDKEIDASLVVSYLTKHFDAYLEKVIQNFNENDDIIPLLIGLQKMMEDMPVLANHVQQAVTKFLFHIKSTHAKDYISALAEKLLNEESGFGSRMVANQTVFAGMKTAQYNELTKQQNIEYVLRRLEIQDRETSVIRPLTVPESQLLHKQYLQFQAAYLDKIKEYTAPGKNFAKHGKFHLEALKTEIIDAIQQINIDRAANGRIIWNEKITNKIPTLYVNLFMIWTLHESPAYFDASNTDMNTSFLKQPHPAQLVAIFFMLNTLGANNTGLPSHIAEVLTGQGKSIIFAATASLVCLLGFAADIGCYSQYLSSRDANAFKWYFEFLGVTEYVKYGTFNRLSEDRLNQNGDLRDMVRNALFDTNIPIIPKPFNNREVISFGDEIDSYVTMLFGHAYQPYFLLQDQCVINLIDAVWSKHLSGSLATVREVARLPEYHICLEQYKGREYLIRLASKEMFADLQRYKFEQGHQFYVNGQQELYYKHFDGTTTSRSIGYQTMWACMDKSNNVGKVCLEKHKGIKITCGAYSYVDLMNHYRANLGLTGTYRELSLPEKFVVKDVFGVTSASFIPSAYGENKLSFTPGNQFRLVADDEYHHSLCEEIAKNRVGWIDKMTQRPILVFFETEEELEAFYQSKVFDTLRGDHVNKMTSQTITTDQERDSLISLATRKGALTLALQVHGRGSDFVVSDPQVIANGSLAVIDGFMPETEAEQRQHQGRTFRQGQDGSFSMVVKISEVIKKFGITTQVIDASRRLGNLYESISAARNKKFADQYQCLVAEREDLLNTIHNPSMELLAIIADKTRSKDEIIAAHRRTLPSTQTTVSLSSHTAKILIVFDCTLSMGDLIDALKTVLHNVIEKLSVVIAEAGGKFELQFANYEDYGSGPDRALRYTQDWSQDPVTLQQYIHAVYAHGGDGNNTECIELGLYRANELAREGLNHVVLIGDEPPTKKANIAALRKPYMEDNNLNCAFFKAQHYRSEVEKLVTAKIPVSTFFTRTKTFNAIKHSRTGEFLTERTFRKIAALTGGETGELRLDSPEIAAEEVTTLIAKKVINTVTDDDMLANELYTKFQHRMHQHSH